MLVSVDLYNYYFATFLLAYKHLCFLQVHIPPGLDTLSMVDVRSTKELQQIRLINSKMTQLAIDPAQCAVRSEGVKTTKVHQTAEMTLLLD